MIKPQGWNGPARELVGSHEDETVYCVVCGNVFVWAEGRDCPTCKLASEMGLGEE